MVTRGDESQDSSLHTVAFAPVCCPKNPLLMALSGATISIISETMKTATRMIKTYTIDPEVDQYVAATKGANSASERVNALLRRAMLQEREEVLEAEAAAFFGGQQGRHRKTTLDFHKAALRTFDRD